MNIKWEDAVAVEVVVEEDHVPVEGFNVETIIRQETLNKIQVFAESSARFAHSKARSDILTHTGEWEVFADKKRMKVLQVVYHAEGNLLQFIVEEEE